MIELAAYLKISSVKNMYYKFRFEKTVKEDRSYKERREERRRYNSSERESDRPSDVESDRRRTRSNTAGPLDSPALVSFTLNDSYN